MLCLIATSGALLLSSIVAIAHKASKTQSTKQRTFRLFNSYKFKKYSQREIAKKLNWIVTAKCPSGCSGYYKEPKILTETPHPKPISQQQTRITAKGPTLFMENGESILQKDVVVTQPGRSIKADKAYIIRDGKTEKITYIRLTGNVRLAEYGKLIVAPYAVLNLKQNTLLFNDAIYHVSEPSVQTLSHNKTLKYDAWGTAKWALRTPSGLLKLWHARYSTCSPRHPTWQLSSSYLVINQKKGQGSANNVFITVHGLPVMYVPYYTFPINNIRKSGFLSPTGGYNKNSGAMFGMPYYWNMAPNYDMLITPTIMTRRGVLISDQFRYLTHEHQGLIFVSFIPDDQGFKRFKQSVFANHPNTLPPNIYSSYVSALQRDSNSRAYIHWTDIASFSPELSADININYVTDSYFFKDFGQTYTAINANQLLNQVEFDYSHLHWNVIALAQAYQTLHLIDQTTNPAFNRYMRLPEIIADGSYPNFLYGMNFDVDTQFVNFAYSNNFALFSGRQPLGLTFQMPIGQRYHFRPSISRPIIFSSGYITPQISLDDTDYTTYLPTPLAGINRSFFSASRNIPIIDVDAGLYTQRDFHFGHSSFIATIEPRFFYLYVPFVNQNKYPIFDTQLLPFSFEQVFALNRFTGFDRLENANQMSFGLTSRILNGTTGYQLLNASVGIIDYFTQPRVLFPSPSNPNQLISPDAGSYSPLVGQLYYYPFPHWSINGNIAYDIAKSELNNASTTISYHRDGRHILSLGYVFTHSIDGVPVDNLGLSTRTNLIDLGLSWPLSSEWSAVAYWYYNIARRHPQSYFVGLQYSTCCWAVRAIVSQSFTGVASNSTRGAIHNQYQTSFFLQVMLKGLGETGKGDPSSLLNTYLPGYQDEFNLNNNEAANVP